MKHLIAWDTNSFAWALNPATFDGTGTFLLAVLIVFSDEVPNLLWGNYL
ncbi:MAG: hypothetical protein AB8G05_02800 [Oligoflexales bacterium]